MEASKGFPRALEGGGVHGILGFFFSEDVSLLGFRGLRGVSQRFMVSGVF